MIEFFSFFLGLTSGVQTVELLVFEPVVAVELRLDGRSLGTVTGEPWAFDCDLSDDLAPHELVAIGRDGDGREVERIRQWINLVAAEEGAATGSVEPLPVPDFTPVAVWHEPGAELPDAGEMREWFSAAGEPVTVTAVERGPAEVVIIRDPAAQPELHAITGSFYEAKRAFLQPTIKGAPAKTTAWSEGWIDTDPGDVASPYRARVLVAAQRSLRQAARLGPGAGVRFLSPWSAPLSHVQSNRKLFATSNRIAAGANVKGDIGYTPGFLEITTSVTSLSLAFRLADAAALAGLQVHDSARRRAVVLLLGDEVADESLFTPAQVRGYLRRLQVPFAVWSTISEEPHPEWGEVYHVGLNPASAPAAWSGAFEQAAGDLRQHLAAQRIVWLHGRHLPQSITLGEAARGLSLAGDMLAPRADRATGESP